MLDFAVSYITYVTEDLIFLYHRCPAGVPEELHPVQGTEHLLEDPGLVDEGPHLDLSFWLHPAAWGTLARWGSRRTSKTTSLYTFVSIHINNAQNADLLSAVIDSLLKIHKP